MTEPIKAVLFDFGGVFTDSPFHAVHAFGEELGIDAGEVTGIVFGSYEQDGDHPWHQLERGEITLEHAREQILGLSQERELRVDIYDLFPCLDRIVAQLVARSCDPGTIDEDRDGTERLLGFNHRLLDRRPVRDVDLDRNPAKPLGGGLGKFQIHVPNRNLGA